MVPEGIRNQLRIYPYEILVLVNVIALHVLLHVKGLGLRLAALQFTVLEVGRTLLALFLVGCVCRLGAAKLSGRPGIYRRRILTWSWFFLSLRLLLGATLVIHVYGWLKGLLRLVRPVLYDQQLWEIDRWISLGISPNVFALHALGEPSVLRFIDATYGSVFLGTMMASFPLFFSMASPRLRLAFATGYATLWLAGAWLYFLVPALGPCYAFPEVWNPFATKLITSLQSQAALLRNYDLVPLIRSGIIHPDFNLMAGIAAFPSLHVGSQTFLTLWARRLMPRLALAFYLSVVLMFVGSVVTGWHYLVDSLAGALLGWLCFRIGFGAYGLRRWSSRFRRA